MILFWNVTRCQRQTALCTTIFFELLVCGIITLFMGILAETKSEGNSNLPLGTIFVIFQSLLQQFSRIFLIQGFKWNANVVDFLIGINFVFKIIGLALNYSDLLYFPCYRWVYFLLFLNNQCYHITYIHPIYHGSLYIIRKIIMRPCFDSCRKNVKKCVDKALKSIRKFLSCQRYVKKCSDYCKIENVNDIDS